MSTYLIDSADFIACHNPAYVTKYDMLSALKDGGVFLLNSPWTAAEMEEQLPASMKQALAKKHAKFYTVDAIKLAPRGRHGRPHQHHHAGGVLQARQRHPLRAGG